MTWPTCCCGSTPTTRDADLPIIGTFTALLAKLRHEEDGPAAQ